MTDKITVRPLTELYRLMDQADAELQSGVISDADLCSYLQGVRDALQWALGLHVTQDVATLEANVREAGEAVLDGDDDLWERVDTDAYRLILLHDGTRPEALTRTFPHNLVEQAFSPLR